MSTRYKAVGNWRESQRIGSALIEVCDVKEVNGRIWPDFAYRVTAPGVRRKTFIGEMAWADAERMADDLYWRPR